MTRKKTPRAMEKEAAMVKTTVLLPQELWEKAKLRAVRDRSNFRTVVIEALDKYLVSDKPRRKS
jgi:hypothetical protein